MAPLYGAARTSLALTFVASTNHAFSPIAITSHQHVSKPHHNHAASYFTAPSSSSSSSSWRSSSHQRTTTALQQLPSEEEEAATREALAELAKLADNDPTTFCINVAYDVKPDRRDEFLQVMQRDDLEPKAMQSVLGQDVDDANKFYLHQEFQSKGDYYDPTTYNERLDVDFFQTDPFRRFPVANDFKLVHDGHEAKVTNVKGTLCLNVQLCIKQEVRDLFLAVIQQNKAGSDAEPLCRQYSWGESVGTFNKFHFHEQYDEGQVGLEAHFAGEHFKVWEEFTQMEDIDGGPFERPPVVQKFVIV
ncbi:hypothetical protein ACHAXR_006147 [Thalassiosira sp. AJA248-18]